MGTNIDDILSNPLPAGQRFRATWYLGSFYVHDYGKIVRDENHPEGPYREHTDDCREVARHESWSEALEHAAKLNGKRR